ncbi:ribbon-helix-helix domain-containing protein [Pontiellaceae bacterium B12227]|nr:ribbon-helix-helix domain-containing protein [Pontiellaceae bacterium B12227]
MVRTQIYLTKAEKDGLGALSKSTGKKQAELIREAVDCYLERGSKTHSTAILEKAGGMWKNRDDLPEVDELRKSWDRS